MADAASRLKGLLEQLVGTPLPVRIRAWDRSQAGPADAPVLVVRNRRALRRLLWKPGEPGLARSWVAGDVDVEGDLYAALDLNDLDDPNCRRRQRRSSCAADHLGESVVRGAPSHHGQVAPPPANRTGDTRAMRISPGSGGGAS